MRRASMGEWLFVPEGQADRSHHEVPGTGVWTFPESLGVGGVGSSAQMGHESLAQGLPWDAQGLPLGNAP